MFGSLYSKWYVTVAAFGVFLFFLAYSNSTPSVHDCIAQGKLTKAEALLSQDPSRVNSVTEKGKTPAHTAVYYKSIEALELLKKYEADLNKADNTGMTPLHDASQLRVNDVVKWLLENGADVEAKDVFGDTPAHTTAMVNGGDLLKLFRQYGADLRLENKAGKTPADLARERGFERAALYIDKLMMQ